MNVCVHAAVARSFLSAIFFGDEHDQGTITYLGEKENHRLKHALDRGYVSFQEGNLKLFFSFLPYPVSTLGLV